MNDEPFMPPQPPPLMSATKARNLARAYKGMANHLRSEGLTAEANVMERDANWWLFYAIALSQTPPDEEKPTP